MSAEIKSIEAIQPHRSTEMVNHVRKLLAEAEAGNFQSAIIIKLCNDDKFGIEQVGYCSRLEMAGALTFALHDVITSAPVIVPPKPKK